MNQQSFSGTPRTWRTEMSNGRMIDVCIDLIASVEIKQGASSYRATFKAPQYLGHGDLVVYLADVQAHTLAGWLNAFPEVLERADKSKTVWTRVDHTKATAYVTPPRPAPRGFLEADALACLEDVVSHASDIHEALAARRLKAHDQDREDAPIDAPVTSLVGDAESYWKRQQEVHGRMVEQAKRALELHKQVTA